jgi:hypothetical protein
MRLQIGCNKLFALSLFFSLLIAQMPHSTGVWAAQNSQSTVNSASTGEAADYAIAYVGPSRDNQQIRLIDPNGSNDRLLWQAPTDTPRQSGIGELSWRGDASELAFDSGHDWQRSLYTRDIYAVSTNGAGLRRLTRPPAPGGSIYPKGTVTFWLSSYASGDVQLYMEGADKPISFPAKIGYAYQITQTVADLGENVRQFVRLYDPNDLSPNWCNYNEEAWVDVVAGQTTDAGTIRFGVADDYTCPQAIRPAWMQNGNDLLYLAAEATTLQFQAENNIWRVAADAPPTSPGTRVLNYSQYQLEGRVFLSKPGPTSATADQLLAAVQEDLGHSSVFRAPIDDAGQREFFDLGACDLACSITGLAWLPDGSGFVFARYEERIGASGIEKGSTIYRYTFADQQVTSLYQVANQAIGRLDLSPDGNQIVYEQSQQLDKTTANFWLEPLLLCPCQIWLVNSDGTDAQVLVDDGRTPVWSPVSLPAAPLPQPVPEQSESRVFLPVVQK